VQRLTDYDIYKELVALQKKLDELAAAALSLRSKAALQSASKMCAKLASAFFKASF
jgi:hypothetical protein